MAAYDFPDTSGKPTDGSFKYTAPDGTLYEWNGYAWEVPSTPGGGGGGGGGAARVSTQALPPSPSEDGDMFWCTDDGRLYIYYEDTDTTQWVDASPDNIGADNGVTQIVAGNNVSISPSIGKGVVTINSTGGGGGGTVVNYNGASAWASFNGTVVGESAIIASQNIKKITRTSVGVYDVEFITPLSSSNYCVVSNIYGFATNTTTNGFTIKYLSGASGAPVDVFPGDFAVHSSNAIAPPSGVGADAWGSVAADGTLEGGFNLSVVKTTTGTYEFSFIQPMPTADYALNVTNAGSDGTSGFSAKTPNGFSVFTRNSSGQLFDTSVSVAVHASSTVTPTYTWTRDGTTLKPVNESDAVVTGNYNPTDNSSKGCEIGAGAITAQRLPSEGTSTLFRGLKGNDVNFEVTADGSASFAGDIGLGTLISSGGVGTRLNSNGGLGLRNDIATTSPVFQCFRNGTAASDRKILLNNDGSATFSGNITAPNVTFNLEADDDTKYTATTDAEGNETRVYNGQVLDVKALLLTLQTAASRIEALEAEVQSLKGGTN